MKNLALVKKYAQGLAQAVKDEQEYESVGAEVRAFLGLLDSRQDPFEDGESLPGVDEGADQGLVQVLARIEKSEKSMNIGPDGDELRLVRNGLDEALGVFLNEGRVLHGGGTACRWIFR